MTNSYQQQQIDLIAENEALKCQVNNLLKACKLYGDEISYGDGTCDHSALDEADTIVLMTPEQCVNSIKADAISEMIGNMPSVGFRRERAKNNWIGDYIDRLRNSNG